MTYEEALEFKNKLPKQIIEEGILLTLYVCPSHPDNFSLFTDYYKTVRVFNDKVAKLFSNDGCYGVVGITYDVYYNELYYKHIPLTYTL